MNLWLVSRFTRSWDSRMISISNILSLIRTLAGSNWKANGTIDQEGGRARIS